ncbi:MAG TPA: endonuclease/exonuclease/phosphatase family protein [Candidatus Acidoferrales bacterium]|nr:endonuclease/exonuclease/phosphatase family protein [Candidatus Acidoferrales bacterium]
MIIKLLQLNINADNYWDKQIHYITSHDFDIIHLQELTGKDTIVGNIHSRRNTFAELQKILQDKYYGVLSIAQRYTSSSDAYMGNGIFYKNHYKLLAKKELILSKFAPFPSDSTAYENVGRTVLHLTFEIENKQISCINTHAAWGGDHIEKPFQTKQGEMLFDYLQTVTPPFVLSGDFNITPDQPLIKKIDTLTRNLITEHKITNTLDPKNHRAKQLFPKGLAVDYIFTSKDLEVKKFAVIDEDLSDHFGLTAEITI